MEKNKITTKEGRITTAEMIMRLHQSATMMEAILKKKQQELMKDFKMFTNKRVIVAIKEGDIMKFRFF